MTHDIVYSWKDFRIHLPSLHEWMKSNAPKYVGASANTSLILHFSEEPSQQTKDRIQMYFDAAKEESESEKRALDETRQKAKKMAIDAIPSMLWLSLIHI